MLALIDYYVCQANKPPHNQIKQGTRTDLNETIRKCSCNVGIYKETFIQIFFMNTGIRSHFSVLAFNLHFGFFVCSKLLKKSFLKKELLFPLNCSKMPASWFFFFFWWLFYTDKLDCCENVFVCEKVISFSIVWDCIFCF